MWNDVGELVRLVNNVVASKPADRAGAMSKILYDELSSNLTFAKKLKGDLRTVLPSAIYILRLTFRGREPIESHMCLTFDAIFAQVISSH